MWLRFVGISGTYFQSVWKRGKSRTRFILVPAGLLVVVAFLWVAKHMTVKHLNRIMVWFKGWIAM